ncbi:MAG: alkaline phosphatase [Bacteroidia bacterium]|nr:alkaline phosphatase [Bacteroidia bacterium]MCF8446642.1 alkaline phosphatase [Bacteroidia bacterium]
MKTRILLIASLFISVFGISNQASAQKSKTKTPKRVVFLIGDGMGLAQISGAMSGYQGQNAFERFTYIGLSKTKSADNYITDSGAGATVFSIGKKAKNGAIGVDSAGKASEGLFEKLKKANWGTGVVATSSITHATPASFYAHVPSRKMEEQIATFLLKGNCDLAIGGGQKFFDKRTLDARNVFEELKLLGFTIKTDSVFEPIEARKLVYTLAQNGMKTMEEGRGDFLLQATKLAQTNLLKYYGNYFLMVEGSQIDWGGHDNNYEYMKAELLDFNSVLNQVLDAAIKDGETLVIVTADHETGGLSLLENKENPSTFTPNYSSKGHSGIMVPVFAFGPGAENFTGIYENTEIFAKLIKLLNLNGND